MRRRQPSSARVAVVLLLLIILSACSHTGKTDNRQTDFAAALVRAALYKPPSTGQALGKVILPNPKLIGCNTSACPPVIPADAEPRPAYPWQVSLDYNNGSVIGLTALYDQPTTIDNVQAAVNERFGQWAMANFRTGPVRLWRVEPERFVINLSEADAGMVRLVYLTFDPKQPTSEKAMEKILDRMAKDGNQ